MILDLHRQGLLVSEIARQSWLDRKTVPRYIERGLEPPSYGPRRPRSRLLIRSPAICANASKPIPA